MRIFKAELFKLISLPTIWLALALGLLVPAAVGAITSVTALDGITGGTETGVGVDAGYQELAFGVMGVIILGVAAVSSEYFTESEESGGGRQITASLTAIPSRLGFLLAKAAAVALVSMLLAAAACAVTMTVLRIILGEYFTVPGAGDLPRLAGVICYWVLTALLAFGLTVLTRQSVIPLAVLITNTSVVTVTYLLTRITPLANYFPDMAGIRMFIHQVPDTNVEISPLAGGMVMTAWAAALLLASAVAFLRRDS